MALIATLILLGLVLIAIELLIIPGFGITGISGIACLIGSVFYAFSEYGTTAGLITVGVTVFLLILSYILFLRSKTWKKLSLEKNITSKAGTTPQEKGLSAGDTGIAVSRIAPVGKGLFHETECEVTSRGTIIDQGRKIQIDSIEENKVIVSEIKQ